MNSFLSFGIVSLLFVLSPGADWAYAISAGIRNKTAIPAVSGLLLGHLLVILIVATGLGLIIHRHPAALFTLSLGGAVYLLWIGVKIFRNPSTISQTDVGHALTARQWTVQGICISAFNPKVFLLFFTIFPQFIQPTSVFSISEQMFLLTCIHMLNCSIIYFIVGYSSKTLLHSRPQLAKKISQISGGLVITIAILLISNQLLEVSKIGFVSTENSEKPLLSKFVKI